MISSQATAALMFCHARRVCHRDIKPENLIISDTKHVLKVADFGLATCCKGEDELLSSQCGSMPFAAPEVMAGVRYNGFKVDVWSLGVVLLELVCGLQKMERIMGWTFDKLLVGKERADEVYAMFTDKDTNTVTNKIVGYILEDVPPEYLVQPHDMECLLMTDLITQHMYDEECCQKFFMLFPQLKELLLSRRSLNS